MTESSSTFLDNKAPQLEKVRSSQKFLLSMIFAQFSTFILMMFLNENEAAKSLLALIFIASGILSIAAIIKLTLALRYNIFWCLLFSFLLFIPIIGLGLMIGLNREATKTLRAAGYKVGIFGAAPNAV